MGKKKATRSKIPPGVKIISVYGSYVKEANVLVRVLKTRIDGVKQHYWVKSGDKEMREFTGRFGLYGSGRELSRAVMITDSSTDDVPNVFTDIDVGSATPMAYDMDTSAFLQIPEATMFFATYRAM